MKIKGAKDLTESQFLNLLFISAAVNSPMQEKLVEKRQRRTKLSIGCHNFILEKHDLDESGILPVHIQKRFDDCIL